VRAIADRVIERSKAVGRRPMGTEGKQDCEWVLVDLQDVIVHVMLPRVREFYALEQLWEGPAETRRAAAAPATLPTAS
jgi:ribosome-associated protein